MDWDKIEQLLNIVHHTIPTQWPKLRPIHEAALAELEKNSPITIEAPRRKLGEK